MVEYSTVPASDAIEKALDYDRLVEAVREAALGHYNLIETLVNAIGRAVMAFPQAASATVEVSKPGAVAGVGGVSVTETFTR